MELVIGGMGQGKGDYVRKKLEGMPVQMYDGEVPEQAEEGKKLVLHHLNYWIRKRLAEQGNPEKELEQWIALHPESILISDEIGNGIVPIDAFEREYRERTGRILIRLAEQAECVERVFCGIGQRLK